MTPPHHSPSTYFCIAKNKETKRQKKKHSDIDSNIQSGYQRRQCLTQRPTSSSSNSKPNTMLTSPKQYVHHPSYELLVYSHPVTWNMPPLTLYTGPRRSRHPRHQRRSLPPHAIRAQSPHIHRAKGMWSQLPHHGRLRRTLDETNPRAAR